MELNLHSPYVFMTWLLIKIGEDFTYTAQLYLYTNPFPWVKRAKREADHSPPSSAEVQIPLRGVVLN